MVNEGNADVECRALLDKNFSLSVPWFLMAGYLYQYCDNPILSDSFWDEMCRDMDTFWDAIEHRHKHLVDRAGLRTGSASDCAEEYLPSSIIFAARYASRHFTGQPAINPFSRYRELRE